MRSVRKKMPYGDLLRIGMETYYPIKMHQMRLLQKRNIGWGVSMKK